MDQRQTFDNLQSLKTILSNLQQQKHSTSFLIDHDGLTRVEGFITGIEENPSLGETIIQVEDAQSSNIPLKQIVAVNGIFRSDYTEC